MIRSVYFLVKNQIPHTPVYPHRIDLQVVNGDQLLEEHITKRPANFGYTSKFSTTVFIEAIDTWLERKLMQSLQSSLFFSLMADECEDISAQEELSICCRWFVNSLPEEHFLAILHVTSTDAQTITAGIF